MSEISYYKTTLDDIEIKRCSNSIQSSKSHIHQELSIGYIEKGSTVLSVNKKDYYLTQGEAVIIYPFVSHQCNPINIKQWKFTMIYVDKPLFNHIDIYDSFLGIKKLSSNKTFILKELIDILFSQELNFIKETFLINTLIKLFGISESLTYIRTKKPIEQIYYYIKKNFLEEISLNELQKKFNINKFTLIRNFKLEYNTTPGLYQLQLKTAFSKTLLKTNNNMTDIALLSGFYDQAHFIREFKKAYGVTPMRYYGILHNK
ncbi:MAG: AraC family transcriptional regulator [Clostridiales bacterium]